jgi:16S rRNA (guanine(966)-N(2))-methyltransferase RsmD
MDSKLQIISGKRRGRKLFLPAGARPTQNRARIALFNMLAPMIDGGRPFVIWDAFAGSGAFGVEILSRYDNAFAIFTDISPDSFKTINRNAANMTGARVEMTDALNAVKRHGAIADLIFIDPPYAEIDLGGSLVRKLSQLAKSGAIVVWESEIGAEPVFSRELWTVLRDKIYGRARFLILKRN